MDTNDEKTELFRPSKRRKFYRKRVDADEDLPGSISPNVNSLEDVREQVASVSPSVADVADEPGISVAEILRQRKVAQRKRVGVEFTSTIPSGSDESQYSNALVQRDEDDIPSDIKSVISRFSPQTGQITEETDKHMYD